MGKKKEKNRNVSHFYWVPDGVNSKQLEIVTKFTSQDDMNLNLLRIALVTICYVPTHFRVLTVLNAITEIHHQISGLSS